MSNEEKYLLRVCENCRTFSPNDPLPRHEGHHVIAIEGADAEELTRVAAAHIAITWNRHAPASVGPSIGWARLYADWFSEEDSVYDNA